MKLTRWFKCWNKQPTIAGWYDAKYEGGGVEKTRYWFDGKIWHYKKGNKGKSSFGNSRAFNDSWRGLAEPPKMASKK